MNESQRNLLILVALAVIGVVFSGAFGIGSGVAITFLNIAFAVGIIWFLANLYLRKRGTIAHIPRMPRLVLQLSALVMLLLLVTGTLNVPFLPWPFGWSNSYPVPFWGLVFLSGFGIWWGWQHRSSRW
jgi:hypothetical protein